MGSHKFLAGDHVTWVDFKVFEFILFCEHILNGRLSGEVPIVGPYLARMKELPNLKDYLTSEKNTATGKFYPPFAKLNN
jgi:hypothetical protein